MQNVERAQDLIGIPVFDRAGSRIGRVGNVYVDDDTNQPEWITVRAGLFGQKETFVPLTGAGANIEESRLDVDVSKDSVRSAPKVRTEHGHLCDSDGRGLFQHYGLDIADDPAAPDPASSGERERQS